MLKIIKENSELWVPNLLEKLNKSGVEATVDTVKSILKRKLVKLIEFNDMNKTDGYSEIIIVWTKHLESDYEGMKIIDIGDWLSN